MLELNATVKPGICEVHTTEYRGFTPEEIAERAVPKVVSVSEGADPEVRLFHVIVKACNDAIQSDRTTLTNLLTQQGHEDMADILRRL